MSKRDELNKLFEEWRNNELHKNHQPFIKDGIVNEVEWKKQSDGIVKEIIRSDISS